jgi:mannose-6-phosphate isomerase-like protein (cupin superfamily)
MNVLDDDVTAPWHSEAYYLAARRRVLEYAGGAELSLIEINGGGQLLPHVQPQRTYYCCIRGEGTYLVGNQEYSMSWGEQVDVPAGTIHAFQAGVSSPVYLICFHAPGDHPVQRQAWMSLFKKLTGRLP